MDGENYIRSLSDSELIRMIKINETLYTVQELDIAMDEYKKRKSAAAPKAVATEAPDKDEPSGAAHAEVGTVEKPEKKGRVFFCIHCGCELPKESIYCEKCSGEVFAMEQKDARKSLVWKIIGGALSAIVLVTALITSIDKEKDYVPHDSDDYKDTRLEYDNLSEAEYKKESVPVLNDGYRNSGGAPVFLDGEVIFVDGNKVYVKALDKNGVPSGGIFSSDYLNYGLPSPVNKNDRLRLYGYMMGDVMFIHENPKYIYQSFGAKYINFLPDSALATPSGTPQPSPSSPVPTPQPS